MGPSDHYEAGMGWLSHAEVQEEVLASAACAAIANAHFTAALVANRISTSPGVVDVLGTTSTMSEARRMAQQRAERFH